MLEEVEAAYKLDGIKREGGTEMNAEPAAGQG